MEASLTQHLLHEGMEEVTQTDSLWRERKRPSTHTQATQLTAPRESPTFTSVPDPSAAMTLN